MTAQRDQAGEILGDLFSVRDRVIAITGAGSGIGQGLALGLARLGAHLFAADISAEKLAHTRRLADRDRTSIETIVCDVAAEQPVRELFEAIKRDQGHVDVVFSNAGIAGAPCPIDQLSFKDWHEVIAVNLDGAFLVAREASRLMKRVAHGKIVFTGSTWGLVGARGVPLAAYAASKGGITNLVRQLALDLAPSGITVNAIAPAAVRTAIADGFYDDEEAVNELIEHVPLGRVVEPSELLGLAVLLAAPASDFITGQTVVIDGGFLAH